jgi:hypothetical protein
MRNTGSAVARHPHPFTFHAAVELTAVLVFAYEGHQGGEDSWHGGGKIITALTLRAITGLTAFGGQAQSAACFYRITIRS